MNLNQQTLMRINNKEQTILILPITELDDILQRPINNGRIQVPIYDLEREKQNIGFVIIKGYKIIPNILKDGDTLMESAKNNNLVAKQALNNLQNDLIWIETEWANMKKELMNYEELLILEIQELEKND